MKESERNYDNEAMNSYDERALPSSLSSTILDSSLISATKNSMYNAKIVQCGNYIQVYYFENRKKKPINDDERELKLYKSNNCNNIKDKTIIRKDNLTRSKLKCQRLAKCNSSDWKTFITLTIADNITDINIANKYYKCFQEQVRRVYPNFKCIGVPEFQKRGAVHYHLLTNIDIDSNLIYIQQENNKIYYHVKYWNLGFTKVDIVKGDIKKIIGYISKYMTKDIDNRLFSHHRYFYTRNLITPSVSYIDLQNLQHTSILNKYFENKNLIYKNDYVNSYNNEKIVFCEYLKK